MLSDKTSTFSFKGHVMRIQSLFLPQMWKQITKLTDLFILTQSPIFSALHCLSVKHMLSDPKTDFFIEETKINQIFSSFLHCTSLYLSFHLSPFSLISNHNFWYAIFFLCWEAKNCKVGKKL